MANEIEKYQYNKLTSRLNACDARIDDLTEEIDLLILRVINSKGYIKYLEAGDFSFRVPYGVTKVYVTAIGGGGAGGQGASCYVGSDNYAYYGGGGGGGGRGAYIIDQEIAVTQGEFLSITVGEGGTVTGSAGYYTSTNGKDTIIKRGAITLLTAAKGTAGKSGTSTRYGSNGGKGGTIGGIDGRESNSSSVGNGGSGGSASSDGFQNYGSGGSGGKGTNTHTTGTTHGEPGTAGSNGLVVVCFEEGIRFSDVVL